MTNRRGFTLIEIMIALTMMLVVTGALYKLMLTTQRLSRAQAEQVNLQSNVRIGSLVVLNDLRELNTVSGGTADRNDILVANPNDVVYRAMRGIGFLCQVPAATQILISRASFSGYRDPQPGRDSIYVFVEGDVETAADDIWLRAAITAVSTATACPGIIGPGIMLTTPDNPILTSLEVGTPVRFFEVMELRLHASDGKSWLGARSVSAGEGTQPVLGPLTDDNGFRLEYLNAAGNATVDLTAIKSVRVTVRGISDAAINVGVEGSPTHVQEELITQVALRNAFRP